MVVIKFLVILAFFVGLIGAGVASLIYLSRLRALIAHLKVHHVGHYQALGCPDVGLDSRVMSPSKLISFLFKQEGFDYCDDDCLQRIGKVKAGFVWSVGLMLLLFFSLVGCWFL